ncbi:MAG TPA: roadblock/LC7 domain-containing protein [Firmicutes bacterium]|nr:roadblock/LC7 domain-containing protein [Bacillota bacterium]
MDEILKDLLRLEHSKGALVVGRDGLVLSYVGMVDLNVDTVGALASSTLGTTEVLGDEAKIGKLDQIILQYEDGIALVQIISDEWLLFLMGDKKMNIGMARYLISKTGPKIVKSAKEAF